jgi:hypothetical protein
MEVSTEEILSHWEEEDGERIGKGQRRRKRKEEETTGKKEMVGVRGGTEGQRGVKVENTDRARLK